MAGKLVPSRAHDSYCIITVWLRLGLGVRSGGGGGGVRCTYFLPVLVQLLYSYCMVKARVRGVVRGGVRCTYFLPVL